MQKRRLADLHIAVSVLLADVEAVLSEACPPDDLADQLRQDACNVRKLLLADPDRYGEAQREILERALGPAKEWLEE